MIVAVTGGKGGVGKSTVALNLGRELGAVVLDLDLATPDLPSPSGPTLHDVLAGRVDAAEAIQSTESIDILPSGQTLEGARAADLSQLPDVVSQVDRQSEYVVLDCPAGMARDVGMALFLADVAVIVTTPDEPALENALTVKDLALDLNTPTGAGVVNKVTGSDHELSTEAVADAMQAPTTAIEKGLAVADSFAADNAVADYQPRSSAVDQFEELAWHIVLATDHHDR